MPPAPSVSVIKALRTDPDKQEAIEGWRNRYDGQSKWGRPWWKDQKHFKGYRGTLVHYTILSALAAEAASITDGSHQPSKGGHLDASGSTYFHEVGDSGWGYEEYYAEHCLKNWSTKAPSANTDEVPSPRQNKYDGEHAWDKAVRGMKWAAGAFNEHFLETGHIDPANVIAVEEFVCNVDAGYAGQFDLLYERSSGETVLADVKTSSGVRPDHKLQSAAYALATEECLDITVDECEILRLYPDKEEVEVSCSTDWDRTISGLQHEFLGLADKCRVEYTEALEAAKEELSDDN